MELSETITQLLISADSKALATTGPQGLNVVPISSIKIVDNKIWLINYFFKKTLDNILAEPHVSLVAWKGFGGYQIRGRVEYLENGPEFEAAKQWVAEILPDRVVKGLLVLTPEAAYDIAPA